MPADALRLCFIRVALRSVRKHEIGVTKTVRYAMLERSRSRELRCVCVCVCVWRSRLAGCSGREECASANYQPAGKSAMTRVQ